MSNGTPVVKSNGLVDLVEAFRALFALSGGAAESARVKTRVLAWTVMGSGFWVSAFPFTLVRLTYYGNCTEVILSRDGTTSLSGAVPVGQSGALIAIVHGLALGNSSAWTGRVEIGANEKIFAYVGGSATVALDLTIEIPLGE